MSRGGWGRGWWVGLALLGLGCARGPMPEAPKVYALRASHVIQTAEGDLLAGYTTGRPPAFLLEPRPPTEGACDPFAGGHLDAHLRGPDGAEVWRRAQRLPGPLEAVEGAYILTPTQPGDSPEPSPLPLDTPGRWSLDLRFTCAEGGRPAEVHVPLVVRPSPDEDPAGAPLKAQKQSLAGDAEAVEAGLAAALTALDDPLLRSVARQRAVRALIRLGRWERAEALSLDAAREAEAAGHVSEAARALDGAGEAARDGGDPERALAHLDRALALDHAVPILARLPVELYARALALDRLGRRLEALEATTEARRALERTRSPFDPVAIDTLELELLQSLGHQATVLARLAALPGPEGVSDPAVLNNIGWLRLLAAEWNLPPGEAREATLAQADAAFEESIRLYAALGQEADVANGLANRAWVSALRGRTGEARTSLAAARAKAGPTDRSVLFFLERVQGVVLLQSGDAPAAAALFRGMEERAAAEGQLLEAGQAAAGFGEALLAMGRRPAALEAFERALRWTEQPPEARSPLHRAALFASRSPWEGRVAQLRLDLGQVWEALEGVERGAFERRMAATRASRGGAPGRAEEDVGGDAELAALDDAIRGLSRLPRSPAVDARLADAEEARQHLWSERISRSLVPTDLPALDREGVVDGLPAGGVLLRVAPFPEATLVWTVSAGGVDVRRVPMPRHVLEAQAAQFAESCRRGAPDAALGEALARALLGPLAEAPPARLDLVTSGALRSLPWEALPAGGRPLLEQTVVRHLPGLLTSPRPAPPAAGPERALIVGDPGRDLPSAAAEAQRLAAERFPGATLLLREEATHAAVTGALTSATVVHFAGHGVSDTLQPWRSHLRLAREERLSLMDLQELQLPGSLVFLNACDAGQVGQEGGALGLADGFLDAGARGVVASRWAVPDAEGARLSERFYTLLREGGGRAPEVALAQTLKERSMEAGAAGIGLWSSFFVLAAPEKITDPSGSAPPSTR